MRKGPSLKDDHKNILRKTWSVTIIKQKTARIFQLLNAAWKHVIGPKYPPNFSNASSIIANVSYCTWPHGFSFIKKKRGGGYWKHYIKKTPFYTYRVHFTNLSLLHTRVPQNDVTETCCLNPLTTVHPHVATYPALHQAHFAGPAQACAAFRHAQAQNWWRIADSSKAYVVQFPYVQS